MVTFESSNQTLKPDLSPTIQSNMAKPIQFTGFASEITRHSITL